MTDIRPAFKELGVTTGFVYKLVKQKFKAKFDYSHFYKIISGRAPDTIGNLTIMNAAVDYLTQVTYARDIFLGKYSADIYPRENTEDKDL